MSKLELISPDYRNKHSIEYLIRYERAEGVHTYHQCPCDRSATRRGMCAICLSEALQELESSKNEK